MEQLIAFLSSIYALSSGCIEYLRNAIKQKSIKKGDFLLKPGQVSRTIYFIEKGLLRAYKMKEDTEVSTWFMMEADLIVSIRSFYKQVESIEYMQALEDSNLWYINYDELQYLYDNFIEFNYVGRVLTIQYYILWDEQLDAIRMRSSRERYEWLLQYHPELLQRVPQKYLASFLDMDITNLSKMKSLLPKRGNSN